MVILYVDQRNEIYLGYLRCYKEDGGEISLSIKETAIDSNVVVECIYNYKEDGGESIPPSFNEFTKTRTMYETIDSDVVVNEVKQAYNI